MSGNSAPFSFDPSLLGKISSLSDQKLIEAMDVLAPVAEAPEVSRLLEDIRPRLRRLRPVRRPTLKRLLCRPLEDLLVSGAARKDAPSIPRSAIQPCWALLQERDPGRIQSLTERLAKLPRGEPRQRLELAREFWQRAAEIITEEEKRGAASEALALIGKVLAVASEIEAFKQALPAKPLMRLRDNGAATAAIREALAAISERGLQSEGYILVVAARLDSPAELFAWMRQAQITIPAAASRLLGAYVIEEVVKQAQHLQAAKTVSPEQAVTDADRLLRVLTDAEEGLKGPMRAELGQRAQHVVEVIRKMIGEHVIEPAADAVAAALPSADAPLTTQAVLAAEAHARALGRTRRIAAQVGLDDRVRSAVAMIQTRLQEAIEAALRRSAAEPAAIKRHEAEVFRSIRLVELVAGPAEAERLFAMARERLAAAVPQAAEA